MITIKVFEKTVVINELTCKDEFVQSLIDKFLTLDYSVSDGNVEKCLSNYLNTLGVVEVLKVDTTEDKDLIY